MGLSRAGERTMNSTSLKLLQRVRQLDDQEAWERFVTLYSPLLHRWATRAGLDEQDAIDLVQDVFVTLTTELPDFEYDTSRGSFRGWLKTITLNKCRERQRRLKAAGGWEDFDPADTLVADNAEAFWESEYREYLVRRALEVMRNQFEPKTWQACWEHTVNGLSGAAVAKLLDLSEGTVYVAKF